MEKIELLEIIKHNEMVTFHFSCTKGLSQFFTGRKFTIHYPIRIDDVPDSILTIPFLSNVIQLVWVSGSTIIVPSLDKDFYDSLPELKKAYSNMFPEVNFSGNIVSNKIEINRISKKNKSAMFFSGGVDSFQTLISHYKEDLDLLTIWGSDIEYNNEDGWNVLYKSMSDSARTFNLNLYTIHSSFRDFDNEKALHIRFSEQLKDSWWHGFQHGLGLLGHVAPMAYKIGYEKMYIASTHSTHDKNVRCSSHPTTDNCIKYCGCQVVHDGFEFRRQNKIRNIIDFSKTHPSLPINLHVCWKTQTGENCCICEKCARTIYAILIEGGDPKKMGFPTFFNVFTSFNKKKALVYLKTHPHLYHAWFDIAERTKEVSKQVKKTRYWKYIKWIAKIDRNNPNSYRAPKRYLRIFVHRVIDKISHYSKKRKFAKCLKYNLKKTNSIILLGTPTHCNIGDAAIAQAERDFLESIGHHVVEITVNEWKKYKQLIIKQVKKEMLLLHGGGNFGNLWPSEESIREEIISSFPASRFLLMPQTFFVTDSLSELALKDMQGKYNDSRFDLFARETYSFEKMTILFPKANCHLVPDIVLFEKNNSFFDASSIMKSADVLMVLRSDREGLLNYDDIANIKKALKKENLSYRISDMLYASPSIKKEDRKKVILQKLEEFASSRAVITDRLHGMIFAFIANVPCIVLQNNNYKIKGVYNWIKDNNSICFADTLDDVTALINKAISITANNLFNNNLFNDLKNTILNGECNAKR